MTNASKPRLPVLPTSNSPFADLVRHDPLYVKGEVGRAKGQSEVACRAAQVGLRSRQNTLLCRPSSDSPCRFTRQAGGPSSSLCKVFYKLSEKAGQKRDSDAVEFIAWGSNKNALFPAGCRPHPPKGGPKGREGGEGKKKPQHPGFPCGPPPWY